MSAAIIVGLGASLAAAAFFASMLGIGGGVVYTPVQVFFGIGIHEAAATSLLLIIILSISATSVYRRAGMVDWAMALLLETFTATGAFAGGYLSDYLPQNVLIIVLMAVVAFAGIGMLRGGNSDAHAREATSAWYRWRRASAGQEYELNLLMALPICFIAGAISGMVGIGGGIFKVPMMVILFGIPMDIAVATSGFMVGITALGGFGGHLAVGHFDWRMGLMLAPGVFIGAWLGAHTMLKIDRLLLKRIFGIAMLIIAIGLFLRLSNG